MYIFQHMIKQKRWFVGTIKKKHQKLKKKKSFESNQIFLEVGCLFVKAYVENEGSVFFFFFVTFN